MRTHLALLAIALAIPACGDGGSGADAAPEIDATPEAGTLNLSWVIQNGATALDCDDVAGVTVRVQAVPVDGGPGQLESFTCNSGSGTTTPFPAGTYDVEVDLRASGNATLVAAPFSMDNVEIGIGADVGLGQVVFEVIPQGKLTFSLSIPSSAGTSVCTDGEVIDTRFELARDGTCAEESFSIQDVGAPYTTNCTTPAAIGECVDTGQVITVDPIPSGPYSLTIVGQKTGDPDPLDCWTKGVNFTVPGNNLTSDLMVQELNLMPVVGCDPNVMIDGGMM